MIRRLWSLEIVRYGLVSVVAFIVDVGLLWLLAKVAGMHYLLAATLSFLTGGVVAYFLAIRFVFRHHRLQQRSVEGLAFIALGVAGLGVNVAVMALMVGQGGAPLLMGKLVASFATFGVNFLLRKVVLFTPRSRPTPEPAPASGSTPQSPPESPP